MTGFNTKHQRAYSSNWLIKGPLTWKPIWINRNIFNYLDIRVFLGFRDSALKGLTCLFREYHNTRGKAADVVFLSSSCDIRYEAWEQTRLPQYYSSWACWTSFKWTVHLDLKCSGLIQIGSYKLLMLSTYEHDQPHIKQSSSKCWLIDYNWSILVTILKPSTGYLIQYSWSKQPLFVTEMAEENYNCEIP